MERFVCFVCLIIGYFFGCIVAAFFVGKANRVDIRSRGSGNLGATNTFRTVGIRAGIFTFIGDFLKVLIACGLVYLVVIVWIGMDIDRNVLFLYTGLGVVLGHNFPVFLKFRGGKGVAASAAVVLTLWDWRMVVAGLVIFFGVVLITGYVSAGSLSLITGEFILFTVFVLTGHIRIEAGWQPDCLILFALIMLLMFWQHRENLKRLANGTENKFSFKSRRPFAKGSEKEKG